MQWQQCTTLLIRTLTSWLVAQQLGGVISHVAATVLVAAARHEPHLPGDGEEVVPAIDVVAKEVGRRRDRRRHRRNRGHAGVACLALPVHGEERDTVVEAVEVPGPGDDCCGGSCVLARGRAGAAGLLELAGAAAGPGAAVLEPVEDVGVADGAKALEQAADARRLVFGRVHHAAVEDGLQDEDLLRLRRPPRPRRRWLATLAAAVVGLCLAEVGVHGAVCCGGLGDRRGTG